MMSEFNFDQIAPLMSFILDSSISNELPDFSFLTMASDLYEHVSDLEGLLNCADPSKELENIIKPLQELYGGEAETPMKAVFEFLKNNPLKGQEVASSTSVLPPLTNTLTHHISVFQTALKRADDLPYQNLQTLSPPSIEGVKVIRLLGRGAHADVFLAERPHAPERGRVVLKCTRKSHDHHVTHGAEIEALRSLQSPHIIRLYDFGALKDHPHYSSWLELEYCAYGNLSYQVSPTMSLAGQMSWVYQLVMAIKDLHQAGFVHRDLKPSNLLITQGGVLKVSDLGVSKRLAPDSRGTLTEAGSMIGTMLYMSPEQVSGVHIDHRSDLWAIATIIYELAVGAPLIKATNPSLASHQILTAEFDLDRPELSQELQQVLSRCLRLDPNDRYQSIDELWADLEPIVTPPLIKKTLELQQGWWSSLKPHCSALLEFSRQHAHEKHDKPAEAFLAEVMPEELLKPISLPLYELTELIKELSEQHRTYLLACEKLDTVTSDPTSPQATILKLTREVKELKLYSEGYLNASLEHRSSKVTHWNELFNPFGHLSSPSNAPHTITQRVLDVSYELTPRTIKRTLTREVKRGFLQGGFLGFTREEEFEREYTYLNPQLKLRPLDSFELSFCPPGECQITPAKTPYKVSFPQGFWLMTTPVTEGLWARVMGDERSHQSSLCPVTRVTWREALKFANILSQKDGLEAVYRFDDAGTVHLVSEANGYRLPSEAAWEYAATAHTSLRYSGSAELQEVAWSQQDGIEGPQEVAQKLPNAWGLYDMTGNVSEWCADVYVFSNERCATQDITLHPPQVLAQGDEPRPSRGGCWSSNERGCLISKRQKRSPNDALPNIGLRLMIPVSSLQ